MPKTGSTALQTTFSHHAAALEKMGVLYPSVRSHPVTHHFLRLGFRPPDLSPRAFDLPYNDRQDLRLSDFYTQWRAVKRQIRRKKPQVLVLSSESLFVAPDPKYATPLRKALTEIADTLEIVAYVRQPSARYISHVQQTLKHANSFPPPGPLEFRAVIEAWEKEFNGPVRIVKFERSALKDGDIFCDFLTRFIPSVKLKMKAPELRYNETMSAEAMVLLQSYRLLHHPDKNHGYIEDATRFRRLLQKIEPSKHENRKPRLHTDIEHFIDHCSIDLLWLRDKHNIRFDAVDYEAIKPIRPELNPFRDLKRADELCEIDERIMQDLSLQAIHKLITPRIQLPNSYMNWLRRRINTRGVRLLRQTSGYIRRKFYAWL